jgi:hypothetical protein
VLAVALAGCGGDDSRDSQASGPKIERATAEHLADLSDRVAGDLDRGDSCAASRAAAELRSAVTDAINTGKVPDLYLEELSGVTNEIQAQAGECAPTTQTTEDEDEDEDKHEDRGKKKGKKKDEDHGGGDKGTTASTPTETMPPETVTEPTTTEATTTTATTTAGTTTSP